GVRLMTHRSQISQIASPAIAHHAYRPVAAGRMLAEKVDRGGDIVGYLLVIHLAAEGAPFLKLVFFELDIWLGAPEQIGADCGELSRCEEIANVAHAF